MKTPIIPSNANPFISYRVPVDESDEPAVSELDLRIREKILQSLQDMRGALESTLRTCSATIDKYEASTSCHIPPERKLLTNFYRIEADLLDYARLCDKSPSKYFSSTPTSEDSRNIQVKVISDLLFAIYLPSVPYRYRSCKTLMEQAIYSCLVDTVNLPRFQCWHTTFLIVHPMSSKKVPHDLDVYDFKKITDSIAWALQTSDASSLHDSEQTLTFSDKVVPGCYVFVSPKDKKNSLADELLGIWTASP